MGDLAIYYSLPFATFLLIYNKDGKCIDAAPIARWCIGKNQNYLATYWARRGAKIVVLLQ